MPKPEHIMAVVREWIVKAENDFKTAIHMLTLEYDCPTDTVCFHAQQCVEKYVKALLVWKEIPFPKTHNLSSLVALLPSKFPVLLSEEEQELLTEYAIVTRYPGDMEDLSLGEARKAVQLARRVRKDIRALLPKEAIPPTRRKKGQKGS